MPTCWSRHKELLSEYDTELTEDGFAELLGTANGSCSFIQVVVLALVDEDRDNQVTRQELLGLQVMADEWAWRKSKEPPPKSILEVNMWERRASLEVRRRDGPHSESLVFFSWLVHSSSAASPHLPPHPPVAAARCDLQAL